ncbi:hypothetical protein ElyMa_000543300 [Elysia marginata]|uniref:Uncharacterized protein n=1 Tax=Elysia marginata TaxID=1093978 RepID=A0AAV4G0K8_9GAST|nr:hypothetical protein ElyMa_000543300 [Elysia marginata]
MFVFVSAAEAGGGGECGGAGRIGLCCPEVEGLELLAKSADRGSAKAGFFMALRYGTAESDDDSGRVPPAVAGVESPGMGAGLWTEVDWVVTVLDIIAKVAVNTMIMMMEMVAAAV